MSNGYFSIQGYQVSTPSAGRTNLGPFNVPFGTITNVQEITISTGTTQIFVQTGTNGVCIIPPIGSPPAGVTLKFKTNSGDSGDYISTQQPTEIQWDTANSHVPSSIYLVVAGGSITLTVQFL